MLRGHSRGACRSAFSRGRLPVNHWNKGRSGSTSSLLYKKVLFFVQIHTYILPPNCQLPWLSLKPSKPPQLSESPQFPDRDKWFRTSPKAPPCCEFRCVPEVLYFRLCPDLKPKSHTHLHSQNASPKKLGCTSCFPSYKSWRLEVIEFNRSMRKRIRQDSAYVPRLLSKLLNKVILLLYFSFPKCSF